MSPLDPGGRGKHDAKDVGGQVSGIPIFIATGVLKGLSAQHAVAPSHDPKKITRKKLRLTLVCSGRSVAAILRLFTMRLSILTFLSGISSVTPKCSVSQILSWFSGTLCC